jgi:hypothetical protein
VVDEAVEGEPGKARAAKAKKDFQAAEKVRQEIRAEALAVEKNTARLRSLRLAKEAAELQDKSKKKKKKASP